MNYLQHKQPPVNVETLKYHLMYLPYKVNIWVPHLVWSGNPPEPDHDEMGPDLLTFESLIGGSQWPIILRPLSDLTEPITIDGETFVPLTRLSRDFMKRFHAARDLQKEMTDMKYCDIEKLKEWHFDFLGLIKERIAINIHEV